MYIYNHNFFIHLSIKEHFFCFWILGATLHLGEQISQDPDFLSSGYTPRSGIIGSYSSTISWGNFTLFCIIAVPPPEHKDSLCSTSSPTHVICCLFDDNHPDRCEVKSHHGSDLHFLVYSLLDQGSDDFILELLWLQMSHSSKLPTYPCLWTPVPSSPDVTVLIGSQNIYEL